VGARLTRFEGQLLTEMARREKVTIAEMLRELVIREAVRPLFGQAPISEVMVDGQD
jgi:hypothetical protein